MSVSTGSYYTGSKRKNPYVNATRQRIFKKARLANNMPQFGSNRALAIAPRAVFRAQAALRPASSLRAEHKSIDINNALYQLSAAYATSANIILLNGIQEGPGFYNRIGRRVEMRSLHINGYLTPSGTAATVNDFVQWAIVYDRQPSGALPNYNDIFKEYTQAGTASTSNYSGVNLDESDRYLIVRNKRFQLPAVTASDATSISTVNNPYQCNLEINEHIKLGHLMTQYNGTTNPTTITNISTGALYFVTSGNSATGANGWVASVQFRLRYDDR